MNRNFNDITGSQLRARDGEIGRVSDVYFDDAAWRIRYFVVDTGSWLNRQHVLISPRAIVAPDWTGEEIPVNLTKEQVCGSPDYDTQKPVSRQHEEELSAYYGWPPYWSAAGGGAIGMLAAPIVAVTGPVAMPSPEPAPDQQPSHGDPHLRSAREVCGHAIASSDGEIGHVEEFLIDDIDWGIRFLVIDTRNWLPGRKVVVAPEWIRRISWKEKRVHVDLRRDSIKASPDYNPKDSGDPGYAERLGKHYGSPRRPAQ